MVNRSEIDRHDGDLLAEALADVVVGARDGIVGTRILPRLEGGADHTLATGDVLLAVRHVVGEPLPPVLLRLLGLVDLGDHPNAPGRGCPGGRGSSSSPASSGCSRGRL